MPFPTVAISLGVSSTTGALILDDTTEGILGTGVLGTELFTDVTSDVLESDGLSINRGSTRNEGPYFRYESGSCQFSLRNLTGDYDPENLSGPYVAAGRTQLAPGLPVRVTALYASGVFTLFVGTVESWRVVYDEAGLNSTAVVTVTDAVAALSVANPVASPLQGGYENAGRRIGRILTNIGWPKAARNIDGSGTEQLQETTLNTAAFDEAKQAADSAFGFLAIDVEGRVVYADKRNMPRVATITFDDSGTNLPIGQVETSHDSEQLFNAAKLTRVNGVEQNSLDELSVSRFGLRTYERADMVLTTDAQVADAASFVVAQFADLSTRIEGISVTVAPTISDVEWFTMLGLDVLDRVTVSFTTPDGRTISRDGLIRGINLGVRRSEWVWGISFYEALEPNGNFVMGSTDYGVLGQNTLALF